MEPSARDRVAGAPVKVDVSKLESGMVITIPWRGKPVWILRRTAEMLAQLGKHDGLLRDPQSEQPQQQPYCKNAARSIRPDYLVVVGICTHLGCVPTLREQAGDSDLGTNWPGGWFCPCHGSEFDLAGRVFNGVPAPLNLVVPPYQFVSESRLRIGEGKT